MQVPRNTLNVAMIGPAAPANDAKIGQQSNEIRMQLTEFGRIAVIQRLGHVEFGVAHA